jgi:hypothetical protein
MLEPNNVAGLMTEFKRLFAEQAVKVAEVVPEEEHRKHLCAFKPMRVLIKKTLLMLDGQMQEVAHKEAQVQSSHLCV